MKQPKTGQEAPTDAPGGREEYFLSKKRSRTAFVLVRISSSSNILFTRLLSIEGCLLQLEYAYSSNRYEAAQIRQEKRISRDSLFAALEPVTYQRFQPYERLARRYFRTVAF
ncbi:hypothetical protein [Nafulsella turpanensis]|uniref:hypothetical protein n=1 Tax=Nafulsella turpanensis TaxID=1265690 RepID=UPI00034A435D|nr:hypothetical protein [Nafulsella turpanensis]